MAQQAFHIIFARALVRGCNAPFKLINGRQRVLMVFRLGCAPLITAARRTLERKFEIAFSPRSVYIMHFIVRGFSLSLCVCWQQMDMRFPADC